jgi:MFS transporter, PPP family, 3-phenylpropionic acid transporter
MFWLRAVFILTGTVGGALHAFLPVVLRTDGFEPGLVGLSMSLGSLAYMVALPIWGHVGDRLIGPRRALQAACIPTVIFAFGLVAPLPPFLIIACLLIISATGRPTSSLADGLAMGALHGQPAAYSRIRLLMSLGTSASTVFFGIVYGVTGYGFAPVMYLVSMALLVLCAQFMPFGRDSERTRAARTDAGAAMAPMTSTDGAQAAETDLGEPEPASRARFGSMGEALSLRPRLLAVMGTSILVMGGIAVIQTYLGLLVLDRGGGPADVGIVTGMGGFAELPGLLIAGMMIGRFGARNVLALAALGYGACSIGFIVIPGVTPLAIVRVVAGFLFACTWLSFILATGALLPPRLQSTGQTLLGAAAWGAGAIMANLVGGLLYGAFGPEACFAFAAGCLAVGAATVLAILPAGLAVHHRVPATQAVEPA